MHALPRIVADSEVGKEVPVVLWRDGKEVTVAGRRWRRSRTTRSWPRPTTDEAGRHATKPTDIAGLGLKVAPIIAGPEGQVPAQRRPEGRGDHRRLAERRRPPIAG